MNLAALAAAAALATGLTPGPSAAGDAAQGAWNAGAWAPADQSACGPALCGARFLAPYFDALQARSAIAGAPPVHILVLGDSHSAGDAISGAWRDILQARYGGGGRGVLPPGDPYYGFLPHGVHVDQTAGWRVEATFGKAAPDAGEPVVFGVSGFRLTSQVAGASIALTAEPVAAFNRVVVCAVAGPGAGDYLIDLDGAPERVSLSRASGVDCHTFRAQSLARSVSLTTEGGEVTLLSWATFRDGGVVVSNLGVVGAQLRHFARADDGAMVQELRAYAPDLIVLEFGTNEGFGGRLDEGAYQVVLSSQIARLKRLSGGVPILVLGAPDAGADRPILAHNAEILPGAPTTGELTVDGWFPPPALARVRAIQRQVAAAEGVAFWDWAARMGGPGSAQAWVAAAPPLMRRDHVHYTTEGGLEIARRLQSDLDAAAAGAAPP
jgi:lysophospholipase L1-like esterase